MTLDEIIAKIRIEECAVVGLDDGCWNYYGRTNANDYATGYIDGRARLLHRYFWERIVGNVPDGMELDHLCRTRRCVNPKHQEPVTGEVNRARIKNPPYRLKELHEQESWQRFCAIFEELDARRLAS